MDSNGIVERISRRGAWSGFWHVNVGEGRHRTWLDNQEYAFIGAGQGPQWARALKRLELGYRIFAYLNGAGYVGFGEVTIEAKPIREFVVVGDNQPLLEHRLLAKDCRQNKDDLAMSEWAAGIKWIKSLDANAAKPLPHGVPPLRGVACRIREGKLVDFLKREFAVEKI